jgi:broad specificity phosphatase PhoE
MTHPEELSHPRSAASAPALHVGDPHTGSPHTGNPRIVLVRHGETEWSLSGQHTGRTDLPLTEAGEEQARAVERALRGQSFGLVLSSPRQRATRTAAIAGFGDSAQLDENLVEWDYGAYEGLTTPQIAAEFGGQWNLWDDGVKLDAEGRGEQAGRVRARVHEVFARVAPNLESGQDVLLFSHGHLLRSLAAIWLGLPIHAGELLALDTASISILGFEHGNHVLRRWNQTPYTD